MGPGGTRKKWGSEVHVRQARYALLVLLAVVCAAPAAPGRPFTLAVIPEEDAGLSAVFFSVLAGTPNATLVEREELDLLLKEAGMASAAGAEPVALGRLAKADALVFVRGSEKRLFVRLTETLRGVRIFEAVGDATAPGAEALARMVGEQVNRRAALLAAPPAERRYVAIDPLVVRKPDPRKRYPDFERMGDLIAAGIPTIPGAVCVEREALDRVDFEKGLNPATNHASLKQADWLIRGQCEVKDASNAVVSLRVESLVSPDQRYGEPLEVVAGAESRAVAAMLSWVADAMRVSARGATGVGLSQEAETHFRLAQTYGARGSRDRALRGYRVAHLLNRRERSYTWTLASGLVGSVGERTDRLSKMEEMIEAMDLCQYVLSTNRCCFNDSYYDNTYPWADLPRFLLGMPRNLDDSGRELVSRFRGRFRGYMEWLYGYKDGVPNKRHLHWLQVMCPYFFEKPDAAMAYLRKLLKMGSYDWLRLSYSNFLAAGHWDRTRARELWEEFLCHLRDTRDGAARYYAMRSIAMLHGGYAKDPTPEGKAAVRALFTWLAEDPARYGFIRHYMSREVWAGFAHMDIAFQRRHLGPLMMPRVVSGGAESAHDGVLQALDRIFQAYPNDPQARKEVAEHLNAYLKKWTRASGRSLHTKLVSMLKEDYPQLLPLASAELLGGREKVTSSHVGLDLVFDYLRDVPEEYRKGYQTDIARYGMCMDPPYVWVTWFIYKMHPEDPKREQARILFVQFDMRSRTSRVFPVRAMWGCCHGTLLRWQDYLCLVAYSAVRIVPFDPGTGTLLVDKATTVKGLPPLGVSAQDVTCVAPGPDDLYVGTTPGMLFRWNPSMKLAEELVRHDRMAPGPLNDTDPYRVTGGRHDEATGSMEFHVQASRGTPKQGWWRYTPGRKPVWQWIAPSGPRTPRVLPAWRVNSHSGIVVQDLEFIAEADTPLRFARATGLVTTCVRWCDQAAVWVIHSRGDTFEGPMRIYMIERENWPDRKQPRQEDGR